MRDIKFRCWDTGINFMYYDTDSYNIYNENDNGLHSGYEDKYGTWHQNILMQYTGLKDKNGVKIYEGDILKIDEHVVKVIFEKCCFFVDGFKNYTKQPLYQMFYYSNSDDIFEVIGNIYEHSHLLESEK